MAVTSSYQTASAAVADNTSDYGSDIDNDAVYELLSQAESQALNHVILESIEEPIPSHDEPLEERIHVRLSSIRQSLDGLHKSSSEMETIIAEKQLREASAEVEYHEGNRRTFSPSNPDERRTVSVEPEKKDGRSPLERFRKPPKKPLSVTDLVSPAWCEQQYEYSLTKYGRVRKTPAMKQGSSVHKELEVQVRGEEVRIEVETPEDRLGLRIWNMIQGLRILRTTGLTRELEVWGLVEGEVVIGIIDEIGTTCPDEQMEAAIIEELKNEKVGGRRRKSRKTDELPADQRTLTDFLTASQSGSVLESNPSFLGTLQDERPPTYYITDVKTRQSKTLPAPGSQSRPTHMQLMIYHRLLTSLASNEVPAEKIFERYKLQPDMRFSDKFIAEIANLDPAAHVPTETNWNIASPTTQHDDPLTDLLDHNTLASIWTLLTSEFAKTFLITPSHSPISPLLTAEFRTASPTTISEDKMANAGLLIGRRSFPFDAEKIDAYVRDEMTWWKGGRETKGVEIEEAYKCRFCEFAEGCTWRATKVEEGLKKARLRSQGRRRSDV